jgi:hypothetical protein
MAWRDRTSDVDKTDRSPEGFDPRQTQGQITGTAARLDTEDEKLNEIFRYHSPNDVTIPKYEHLRAAAKYFASVILLTVPPGADRTCALRHIRDAVMTANSAVALDGLSF